MSRSVRTAAGMGLLATGLCFAWLALNTYLLRGGNWSSVFYTGDKRALPAELTKENTYRYPGVVGYDGQQYHAIAHDPLFRRGIAGPPLVDWPRMRYRRILVPGLAAFFSFGHDNWVDTAYICVILASFYLGTFWLTRWTTTHGFSAWWGLLFLLLPSTLVTLEFFIVDSWLVTLIMGFLWYAGGNNHVRMFLVLTGAGLARETGLLVIAAYCLWLVYERQWTKAVVFGMAAVPTFLWLGFVQMHTPPNGPGWFSWIPFLGVYYGIVGHWNYPQRILLILDFVALAAMLAAFALAAYYITLKKTWQPATFMAGAFLLLAIFLSHPEIWPEVNAYGRYYTPILMFVAMLGATRGNWWSLAPLALVDLRILAVFAHHAGELASAVVARR